jgi:hypothetical protein
MQTIATGFDSAVAIPTYNNQTGTTYTFALSDIGKTVTASNAGASTYTIPPTASVTWPSNTTLDVVNLGAGVVTFAAGAGVTVTNTAATLAQYQTAQLVRTGLNAWTVVPAGGSSGLTKINTTTFSAVASQAVSNVFSATYDNYMVQINITAVTVGPFVQMRFRDSGGDVSAANYGYTAINFSSLGAGSNSQVQGRSQNIAFVSGQDLTGTYGTTINIMAPNLATRTFANATGSVPVGNSFLTAFAYDATTQMTGFSLIASAGTFTGTVTTYGVQK